MENEVSHPVAYPKACPRTMVQIKVFKILGAWEDPDRAYAAGAQFAEIYDIHGDRDPESIAQKISNAMKDGGR